MRKKSLLVFLSLFIAIFLISCKSETESIVGLWETEGDETLEFFADGTAFDSESNSSAEYSISDSSIVFSNWWTSESYRYQLTKNTLTLTSKKETITYYRVAPKGTAPKKGVNKDDALKYANEKWNRKGDAEFIVSERYMEQMVDGFYYNTFEFTETNHGQNRLTTIYHRTLTYKWNYANKKWIYYDEHIENIQQIFNIVGKYYADAGNRGYGNITINSVDFEALTANISYDVTYHNNNSVAGTVECPVRIDTHLSGGAPYCAMSIVDETCGRFNISFDDTSASFYFDSSWPSESWHADLLPK